MDDGHAGGFSSFFYPLPSILEVAVTIPPPTARQARVIWLGLTSLAITLLVAVLAVIIWGLGQVLGFLSPVLWPLAVAGVIAYLLDPLVDFFERKRFSRAWAIVTVFAIAMLMVAGVLAIVIPPIVKETRQFAAGVPEITKKVQQKVESWINNPPDWFQRYLKNESGTPQSQAVPPPVPTNDLPAATETNAPAAAPVPASAPPAVSDLNSGLGKTLQSATGWLARFLPKAVSGVMSWFGVLIGMALVPIYAFYLLLEKSGIQSKWTNYLPIEDSRGKDEVVFILSSINDYLIAFFRGQVLVAICDGILYGIGFLIIGLPYAILLGAAAMVLTIVPFIGAWILFVVAMIISLVRFGDWKHPLLVIVVFVIVQGLESVVVSPRIMKGRVGLHPLTIIIAVMVGTTLFGGLLGGVLAIPLTAVLRVLMERYIWKRPASRA